MNLTQDHINVLTGKICPYCGSNSRVGTETELYGREYKGRKIHFCSNYPKCDSYVGSHDDGKPLGRLADNDLRKWKIKAHNSFDKLWKDGFMKRSEAYKELSEFLNTPSEYTHIGMFKTSTLIKVVAWSNLKYHEFI